MGALGMPRALTRGRDLHATNFFHTHRTQKNKEKSIDFRTGDSYNPDKSFEGFAVSYRSTSFPLSITEKGEEGLTSPPAERRIVQNSQIMYLIYST